MKPEKRRKPNAKKSVATTEKVSAALVETPNDETVVVDLEATPGPSTSTDQPPPPPQLSVVGVNKICALGWSVDEFVQMSSIIRESHTRSALTIKMALGNRSRRSVQEIQDMLDNMQAMINEEDISRTDERGGRRRQVQDWLDVLVMMNNERRHRDLSPNIYKVALKQIMRNALDTVPHAHRLSIRREGADSEMTFSMDRMWDYFIGLFTMPDEERPSVELTDVERQLMHRLYTSMDTQLPDLQRLVDDLRAMADATEDEANNDVKPQIDDVEGVDPPVGHEVDWGSVNPFDIPLTRLERINTPSADLAVTQL